MMVQNILSYLPPPLRTLRPHHLDGKLLLFDRDSGINILMEGDETQHLERIAPRTLLIAVTNHCNLDCPFCYRDQTYASAWRYESLLEFCQQADAWGVLEVAFGGGEPILFPRWSDFIHELYVTTRLCINFTTNGMLLTEEFLQSIAGKYGQIRLSLYDTNHPDDTLTLLRDCGARYGVNWLITPDELATIEQKFDHLLELGVRDFLLIGYKGSTPDMHFRPAHYAQFSRFLNQVYAQHPDVTLKLDVCWGNSLPDVPRLFVQEDCGAGDGFLSITSHKAIKPCSFHEWTIPFETLDDVKRYWQQHRHARTAATIGGCARLPHRGITT
jgi:MoaA/NifB/PqqE/SkfB family radical SAM enzyme